MTSRMTMSSKSMIRNHQLPGLSTVPSLRAIYILLFGSDNNTMDQFCCLCVAVGRAYANCVPAISYSYSYQYDEQQQHQVKVGWWEFLLRGGRNPAFHPCSLSGEGGSSRTPHDHRGYTTDQDFANRTGFGSNQERKTKEGFLYVRRHT